MAKTSDKTCRIAAYFARPTYTRELPTGGFEYGEIDCDCGRVCDHMKPHGRRSSFAEAEQDRGALALRLNAQAA